MRTPSWDYSPGTLKIARALGVVYDSSLKEQGVFILIMHPHVIGHRGRIAMLDRLVTHMKSKPGVWFATHEEIAKYVKGK